VGIVAFGSIIAQTAVLLVFQLGQPRIFFSMSRDGLLPPAFGKVHPRFRTPWISTVLTGLFVAFFAAFARIDEMVDLTNIGTLFAFIIVCSGVAVLRAKDPSRPRPFRVPAGRTPAAIAIGIFALAVALLHLPLAAKLAVFVAGAAFMAITRNYLIPALGVVACAYLMAFLPSTSWLRFAAWLNLGLVIYVGYSARHSRIQRAAEPADRETAGDDFSVATGAWLALAGTAVLFLTRGFEIIQTGVRTHAEGALARLLDSGAWLEPSAFFITPLALNGFVLCPIVARRAHAARRRHPSGPLRRRATVALTLSLALLAVAAAYLALVVARATAS
jgi:amino acid transporter